ncbi:hypothetical protein B6U91_01485 [Candidatus Pacearchaeota archaeon ex4484_71]|nr:MAG: hypothetical protein B6U91_01485 [Candidatus Pacearchaeota archaeon ex4484_71]
MKNFEDKFYVSGSVSEVEKVIKILEDLPAGTFPTLEGDLHGREISVETTWEESAEGKGTLGLKYLNGNERRVNIPPGASEVKYVELEGLSRSIEFLWENVRYKITIEDK